jgi:hypothetical protein
MCADTENIIERNAQPDIARLQTPDIAVSSKLFR